MEKLIQQYCEELNIILSHEMPAGYEDAYGTFDVCQNTLFLNREYLAGDEQWKIVFFHELRHAQQYKNGEDFSSDILESLPYVILYDGTCYKLSGNEWRMCKLDGEDAFRDLYMSLPYEMDANRYAYEKTVELYPNEQVKLKALYMWFLPQKTASMEHLRNVFRAIDHAVCQG